MDMPRRLKEEAIVDAPLIVLLTWMGMGSKRSGDRPRSRFASSFGAMRHAPAGVCPALRRQAKISGSNSSRCASSFSHMPRALIVSAARKWH